MNQIQLLNQVLDGIDDPGWGMIGVQEDAAQEKPGFAYTVGLWQNFHGMLNAITRTSQDLEDYDRATELERDGSKVLSLPASSWKAIAMAK